MSVLAARAVTAQGRPQLFGHGRYTMLACTLRDHAREK
jgi:hypothetical protein